MKTAIVTGASRGIGRAIAISLGEVGYTVYVTGRSRTEGKIAGTIDRTADEVSAAGGVGIAVACDHGDLDQIAALFERVRADGNGLDVLVNNVFPNEHGAEIGNTPFFDESLETFETMLSVGLRSHYVATWRAVQLMRVAGAGIVINVSSAGAVYSVLSPGYCLTKAALDKFTIDSARELKPLNITTVSLWPGPLVGTEMVATTMPERADEVTESPFVSGRAVTALVGDDNVKRLTGRVLVAADVIAAYGLTDIDGSVPPFPFDEPQMQRQLLRRCPLRIS